jgi:hypothetical protein
MSNSNSSVEFFRSTDPIENFKLKISIREVNNLSYYISIKFIIKFIYLLLFLIIYYNYRYKEVKKVELILINQKIIDMKKIKFSHGKKKLMDLMIYVKQ